MRQILIPTFVLVTALMMSVSSDAQTNRRRTSTPIPAPTATPSTEPMVISRADDFPDDGAQAIPPDPNELKNADRMSVQSLEELGARIKNLEAAAVQTRNKPDPDEKQKRLLLNLDIVTKAEQRAEDIRKRLFELMEKENTIRTRIDSLDYDLRPEMIERTTAITGSLRPEEMRANRKKALETEKTSLQNLLVEIQKNKTSLETSLQRADAVVEKLRMRLDKEIDTALDDQPNQDN